MNALQNFIYTYYVFHILPQIWQPSQYRCTQLQYIFAVISEAPSTMYVIRFYLFSAGEYIFKQKDPFLTIQIFLNTLNYP